MNTIVVKIWSDWGSDLFGVLAFNVALIKDSFEIAVVIFGFGLSIRFISKKDVKEIL